MFRRSNSHKDVPASPKLDPEKAWHEKAWHEKTPAISQESIASLAAPGQAYLRMHAATPDVGAPLPPLPTYQATGPSIQDRWGLHIPDIDDPVSRQFGTPQPEQRRTLVIVNRSSLSDLSTPPGSNRETMLEVQTTPRRVPLPILPDYLPTPTKTSIDSTSSASGSLDRPGGSTPPSAPSPASSKTSLRDLLLPAIERRKRAMEDRINPFVDERGDAAEVLNTPAPTPRKNDTGVTKSQNTNPSQSRNPFYDVSFDSDIVDEFPSPPRSTAQSNRNPFSDQNPFVAAAEAAGVGPPPVNPFAQRCGRV